MSRSGYPTFITVNPDGTVSYDFNGHIHADGLDIDAIIPPAGEDGQVRFLYGPTGEVVSLVTAFSVLTGSPIFGGANNMRYRGESHIVVQNQEADDAPGVIYARAVNSLEAQNKARTQAATVKAQWNEDNTSQVYVTTPGQLRTLIDSAGRSDFLQWLGGATGRRVQIGSQTFAAAVGDNFLACNVTPWGTSHDLFLAAPQAITSFPNMTYRGAYVISNAQGGCVVNSGIVQNITVRWMSIGI